MRIAFWVYVALCLSALLSMPSVDAKKKKKTASEEVKSNIKEEKKEEIKVKPKVKTHISFDNSTFIQLKGFNDLSKYLIADKFSLLFAYHEENEQSIKAIEELKKVENKLRGYANFLLIGCHLEAFQNDNTKMCKESKDSNIFPIISGIVPVALRMNPYTKKIENNNEVPFTSSTKDESTISKFVTSKIPNFVESIRSEKEYKDKVEGGDKINKVVLFSEKKDAPVIYKALATHFRNKLQLFFVDSSSKKLKIKGLKDINPPKIVVHVGYDNDGEAKEVAETVHFNGEINFATISTFLENYALDHNYDPNNLNKPQSMKRSSYTIVNFKNYTKGFVDDYRAQVVFFDKSLKTIEDKFTTISKTLHGPANVVFFDCSTDESTKIAKDKFGVKSFPKLLVFTSGGERNAESSMEISLSNEVEDIIHSVTETEIKDNLRDVSDSVISSVIVTNGAQFQKVTLVYLFQGEEDQVPLSFRSVSANPLFAKNFEFIALNNPSVNTLKSFQVQKLPTVIGGLPSIGAFATDNPETANSIRTIVYQGNIDNYYEFLEYNLGILEMVFPKVKEETVTEQKSTSKKSEFQEITASNVDDICESHKGFCVIGVLNGDVSNELFKTDHLEKVSLLSKRNEESGSQFKYMWLNATCHQYLLEKFDLNMLQLPSIIIYSPSQKKYAKMLQVINNENLIDFEQKFEGKGAKRVSIYDVQHLIQDTMRDIDCPNIKPQLQKEEQDGMLDKSVEDEIMKEILEEERKRKEQLEGEVESDSDDKKKKKKKPKKKN